MVSLQNSGSFAWPASSPPPLPGVQLAGGAAQGVPGVVQGLAASARRECPARETRRRVATGAHRCRARRADRRACRQAMRSWRRSRRTARRRALPSARRASASAARPHSAARRAARLDLPDVPVRVPPEHRPGELSSAGRAHAGPAATACHRGRRRRRPAWTSARGRERGPGGHEAGSDARERAAAATRIAIGQRERLDVTSLLFLHSHSHGASHVTSLPPLGTSIGGRFGSHTALPHASSSSVP